MSSWEACFFAARMKSTMKTKTCRALGSALLGATLAVTAQAQRVPDTIPMMSLENAKSEEEFREWTERIRRRLGDDAPEAFTFSAVTGLRFSTRCRAASSSSTSRVARRRGSSNFCCRAWRKAGEMTSPRLVQALSRVIQRRAGPP